MIKKTPVTHWDLAVQRVEASFSDNTIIYIVANSNCKLVTMYIL